nr:hypothetical protein CFP56_61294 [Quercus suber]
MNQVQEANKSNSHASGDPSKAPTHVPSSSDPSFKIPILTNVSTENFSILHGYDGSSFQQHYINRDFGYRLQCYYTEPGIVDDIFNVLWYWKSHKYLQPNHWLQSWLRREIQALIQLLHTCST